jgi:hypothetical protein
MAVYHAGEYAMRFHQNVLAFLGLMLAFVGVAYAVARWQGLAGLRAWGLTGGWRSGPLLVVGLAVGLLAYGLAFGVRLWLHLEVVAVVPNTLPLLRQTLVFSLGTFLPSLAEDILTRGYVFRHLRPRFGAAALVVLSATIYVLNHWYALGNGPAQLVYLFVLGLMLAVPLAVTRNLWYTVGAHWAGNIVYRFTTDVLTVQAGPNQFPGLWELTFFVALLIPINYFMALYLKRRLRLS